MVTANSEQESNDATLSEAARATMVSPGVGADEKITGMSGQRSGAGPGPKVYRRRRPILRVKMLAVAL